MNLSLASLFSFGASQFEKKDSFFFKWPFKNELCGIYGPQKHFSAHSF